jgi:hypothetical protein
MSVKHIFIYTLISGSIIISTIALIFAMIVYLVLILLGIG